MPRDVSGIMNVLRWFVQTVECKQGLICIRIRVLSVDSRGRPSDASHRDMHLRAHIWIQAT